MAKVLMALLALPLLLITPRVAEVVLGAPMAVTQHILSKVTGGFMAVGLVYPQWEVGALGEVAQFASSGPVALGLFRQLERQTNNIRN